MTLSAVVLLLTATVSPAPARPEAVLLDPERCHFFAAYSATNAEFLALLGDGGYVRIDREHMFVRLTDEGTWTQLESGEVRLTSRERFRNVEAGPLSVFLWYDGPTRALAVAEKAKAFLAGTEATEFTRDEIEEAFAYPAPVDPSVTLSYVHVDYFIDGPVARSTIADLIEKLETYASGSDVNLFHFTPLRSGGWTFLRLHDFGIPSQRDAAEIVEKLAGTEGDRPPAFVFIEVPSERFLADAGRLQPFVHYTEMNERLRAEQLPVLREIESSCP